jgi:hypothetical protein
MHPRPTHIRIVPAPDRAGYSLILYSSDGTEQLLEEGLGSVSEAQERARHYADQFGDDLGSTITVEPWTDTADEHY